MPTVTRWFIKSSLAYLVLGLLAGLAAQASGALPVPAAMSALRPTALHILMVGWITQLIFGVAYWMFPILSREQPRGSDALAVATFASLNAGLLLRIVAEPLHAMQPGPGWGTLLAVSGLLQWIAALLFAVNIWARIRGK